MQLAQFINMEQATITQSSLGGMSIVIETLLSYSSAAQDTTHSYRPYNISIRVVNQQDIYNGPAGPISIKCRGTPATKNRIIGIVLPYRHFHLKGKQKKKKGKRNKKKGVFFFIFTTLWVQANTLVQLAAIQSPVLPWFSEREKKRFFLGKTKRSQIYDCDMLLRTHGTDWLSKQRLGEEEVLFVCNDGEGEKRRSSRSISSTGQTRDGRPVAFIVS